MKPALYVSVVRRYATWSTADYYATWLEAITETTASESNREAGPWESSSRYGTYGLAFGVGNVDRSYSRAKDGQQF